MLFNFLNSWCLHFLSHPQPPNIRAHICQTFMQINSNQVQFVLLRRLWTKNYFLNPNINRSEYKPNRDRFVFLSWCCCFRRLSSQSLLSQTGKQMLTFSTVEFQSELLPGLGLLGQPLLQLLLLLQQLADLLVVVEGLAHQLSLGHPGMFKLKGDRRRQKNID